MRSMRPPSSTRARLLRGPFAALVAAPFALLASGPIVACNDPAPPVYGCSALASKTLEADATVKAYADASARLYVAAYQVDQQFLSICNGVMRDVQPTFAGASTATVACDALAVYLQADLAKGVTIAFDVEGGCALDLTTEARCEDDCATSAACELSTQCPPDQLVTECSGSCTGTCEVRDPAATVCSGTCDADCAAPSSASCSGTCDGSCDAVSWTGTCDGGCSAGFDGSCAGTCKGSCNGTATLPGSDGKPTGVQCPGRCVGTCDQNASGTCEAPCVAQKITDRFHGHCVGNCTGSCTHAVVGACNGPCSGTCANPSSTARCNGTCHGACDTADAPQRCLSGLACTLDPNCLAGCAASGYADSNCKGTAHYVIGGDATLWASLNSRASAIATVVLATKALSPHIDDVVNTIGPATASAATTEAGKLCYSETGPVAQKASDTIALSLRNAEILKGAP